ncbi:MAG: response regulator receiver protein [halophilic archaeon J07HX64]|nr:MAG: response regulator receiver protein [halophilic archaeon J07HX64]
MAEDTTTSLPVALVVDDEKEVADAYALRLRGICDVETVYNGPSALEVLSEKTVDLMLLDRHMPGMSGDEVLEELNNRDYDGRVVMVTAIDPGFDVLDMPFDDYLCKPVDREDIREVIGHQSTILGYKLLGEYFSAESKRQVITAEVDAERRADHDEYQRIATHARQLEQRARRLIDESPDLLAEFDAVDREGR